MNRSIGSSRTQAVVRVRGPGVSFFGLPGLFEQAFSFLPFPQQDILQ